MAESMSKEELKKLTEQFGEAMIKNIIANNSRRDEIDESDFLKSLRQSGDTGHNPNQQGGQGR